MKNKLVVMSMLLMVLASMFAVAFNLTPVKALVTGDLNEDGKVDIKDLAEAAKSFGSYPGHPRWNPEADINSDGIVDIKDLVTIAKNFGKTDP